MLKRFSLTILILLSGIQLLWAQMPGGVPVERSTKTQWMNGREFFVHVVQRGQTVYSISKAYGIKDYDAVVKKDIHFLDVGDTVWIPVQKVNEYASVSQPPSQVTTSAPAVTKPATAQTSSQTSSQAATQPESQPKPVPQAVIRDRVSPSMVVVSLMMPLFLDQIESISTTKFDVEQRGRKSYKQFEFIQFYEGIQMALNELQQQGVSVRLNVVDVANQDAATVERQWRNNNVGSSDVVITLLPKESFARAAQLAADDHVFIVNPLSMRDEIVNQNPYVVKCQPSASARIRRLLEYMRTTMPGVPLYIVHSKSNAEKPVLEELRSQLSAQTAIRYTFFDWAASGKLASTFKGEKKAVVLSVYDAGRDRNRTYNNTLLSRLSSVSSRCEITLVTLDNWCDAYPDVDLTFLQNQHYHTFLNNEWDYGNRRQLDFLRDFYRQYHVEPSNYYAALGHDAILYFVSGIHSQGTAFWRNPNLDRTPEGMLRPVSFHCTQPGNGFEGNTALLYRMNNYQFFECR